MNSEYQTPNPDPLKRRLHRLVCLHLSKCHIVGNHIPWLILKMSLINVHDDVSSTTRGPSYGLSFCIYTHTLCMRMAKALNSLSHHC